MAVRIGVILAALIAILTGQAPARQRIAFARAFPNPGQLGLFIAAADGSNERLLLAAPDLDYDPAWAPDGRSIVFTSERNGSADLYRVNPDGTGLERLTDHPAYDDQAAFSPDGTRIVFVSTRAAGGTADLWTMNLATRVTTPLTAGPGGDFRPAWSPDGQWIAYASDRDNTSPFGYGRWERLHVVDLVVVRPDGSGRRTVTASGDFCGSPKWTPDSRRLVAYCMTAEQTLANRRPVPVPGSHSRLVSIDISSGVGTEIAAGPGVKLNPTPLAGNDVGYIRKDAGGEAEGSGIYYISGKRGPRGDIRVAAWSPDSAQVVFHKRLIVPIAPFRNTFSRHPGYDLSLTGTFLASFSPDGTRFVTNSRPTRNATATGATLLVTTTATGRTEVIYENKSSNVLAPQWSARGDRIIFAIGTFEGFFNGFHGLFLKPEDRIEGGAHIATITPDGTGYQELTSRTANNAFPSWSPDGTKFVFRTFGPDGNGLRIMDVATRQVTTLTREYDNFPLWSPRGDLITFSRQADGAFEIYTIRPDGTKLTRLTFTRGNDAHMAWSPDGEFIVFVSSRLGFKDEAPYTDAPQPYGDVFVMRYDGTDVHQLTDNQWEDGTPAWQPAGTAAAGAQ